MHKTNWSQFNLTCVVPYPRLTDAKAGTWLAGGHYACLWANIVDLDYCAKALGLPRWSLNDFPRALCKCCKCGSLSWLDCRKTASWVQTCWKPSEWLAWPERSKCKLFTLPGLSACTVALDWMHCKYLGSDQYMFGSVMWLLCFVVMPETPLQNLLACWIFISRFYKEQETEHRFKFLNKLSMFVRKSGFPKLRGKAAEKKRVWSCSFSLVGVSNETTGCT